MAITGTVENQGHRQVHKGVAGASDNDIVIETGDVGNFNVFQLKSTAGAMDVEIDLGDGLFVGPRNFADLSATSDAPVIVTAAGKPYGWRGNVARVRVRQNGSTGVTGAVLRCSREL